jgi:hypothetical protein
VRSTGYVVVELNFYVALVDGLLRREQRNETVDIR